MLEATFTSAKMKNRKIKQRLVTWTGAFQLGVMNMTGKGLLVAIKIITPYVDAKVIAVAVVVTVSSLL